MGESLPPRAYTRESGGFLGGDGERLLGSEDAAREIDREINDILDEGYNQALDILKKKRRFLDNVADNLLKNETLDKNDLDIIAKQTEQESVINKHT
jgi:cell division protease FtsH